MNDIGGMNISSGNSTGGTCSDASLTSGSDSNKKLCRDFIRNVCSRGKNCKFIHPENIKIRTEPIFCHDFQQGRCRRSTCKFIHCSREVEDYFKKTGDLPENLYDEINLNGIAQQKSYSLLDINVGRSGKGYSRMNGNIIDKSSDFPVCMDYLKGVCNRPPGSCKYRHINSQADFVRNRSGRSINGNAGGVVRRRCSDGLFEFSQDLKRSRSENSSYDSRNHDYNEDFYVGSNITRGYSALPPPTTSHTETRTHTIQSAPAAGHHIPTSQQNNQAFSQYHQSPVNSTFGVSTGSGSTRNGYNASGAGESTVAAYIQSQVNAETIKALEDENFMLKRRIEELKTSNEFLLSQNAQLRLNSSLSVSRTSVGVENVQVQPTVGVATCQPAVVQTMVSLAQPMGMTPSLSVAATQSLSTISTLPTVSMPPVSISQALPVVSIAQHQPQPQTVYPMVTTQGVLPQPPNLS